MTRLLARTAFALCIAVTASQASASVLFTFTEVGSDVVETGSGSFSLGGPPSQNGTVDSFIQPNDPILTVGPQAQFENLYIVNFTGAGAYGTGGYAGSTSASGDTFGFLIDVYAAFAVPENYASGALLSGESTFNGQNFLSLGLTPGTYDYTYSFGEVSDQIRVQVGPSAVGAVPEPASLALSGIGLLAGIGAAGRRKRLSSTRSNDR